jgi:uncharacterized membrane protein
VDSFSIAKALHILGVVLWIGGVAFVTFILIPAIRRLDHLENQYDFFEKIEHRFAWQARFTTLLTGITGFYLTYELNAWSRFMSLEFWWMHAMVLVWLIFTLMLFVLEPLVLHKAFKEQSIKNPKTLMKKVYVLHLLLIGISLITILGAMIGTH